MGDSWKSGSNVICFGSIPTSLPQSTMQGMESAQHHQRGAGRRQQGGPGLNSQGDFPSFWGRLTFFRDLQGQCSGPESGPPELKREETAPEDKAGAGAKVEPAAEIHRSRPETGGVVRNPKRPAGSKPSREEPDCVGRRAPEALVPRAEGQDKGVKPKR